jgi:hypothetical protein
MLGCNQDVTVWIRKKIPGTGQEVFTRSILPVKCRWKNQTERSISNGAANIFTSAVIIVPYFDGISNPDIQPKEGDIMALGVCDIDITGITPYTAGEVKRLIAPNIATVKSIAYNFSDNMKGKHLRLTGN